MGHWWAGEAKAYEGMTTIFPTTPRCDKHEITSLYNVRNGDTNNTDHFCGVFQRKHSPADGEPTGNSRRGSFSRSVCRARIRRRAAADRLTASGV